MAQNLPIAAQDYYSTFVQPQGTSAILEWFTRQVYLAVGVLLSACAMLGVDSTPMEGIDPIGYDRILGNPQMVSESQILGGEELPHVNEQLDSERFQTVMAVAIGTRAVDDFNDPSVKPKMRRELADVVVSC